MSLLLDSRLVHLNRVTDTVEPALAERWTVSPDGLTYTFRLRDGVRFSDGVPFTSADVEFTARVVYDERVASPLAGPARINGQPLRFAAPDPRTVVVTLPSRFAPGIRLLDGIPILPKHRLEAAFLAGTLKTARAAGTPAADVVGLGPFVLREHVAGQRMVFARNPHYWRRDAEGRQLPYLDTFTLAFVRDQNAEALGIASGEIDLMATADTRPEDYVTLKREADAGRLQLLDAGPRLDPDMLWFNLTPEYAGARARPWLRERAFRQAVSYAVDRQGLADGPFLGAAVPIHGPVSPINRTWYSDAAPKYPLDRAKARELLASIGLTDRNGDGMLEDAAGAPARFSILTQAGHVRERSAVYIQEQLRQVGLTVDVVATDPNSLFGRFSKGDYDSIYFYLQASSTDPALAAEFWLSRGAFHVWNPRQQTPATPWEARIDELMTRQAAADSLEERQRLFAEVQQIMGEELPAIYFVAPKVYAAVSSRVRNARPVPQAPQLLWDVDMLAVR